MKAEIGKKYLITTDNWFFAPDGKQYRSVFGTIKDISDPEKTLGIDTNKGSTNWYITIGSMIIAGCCIHYVIQTDKCELGKVKDCATSAEVGIKHYTRPSAIYNADQG